MWDAGVEDSIGLGGDATPDAAGEVLQPHLVLEVVLVEEGTLEQIEVSVGGASDAVLAPLQGGVVEADGPQSGRLGDLEQRPKPFLPLEAVEHRRQLRAAGQALVVHGDGQPEVHREHDQPDGSGMLSDEVVDGGHHPVAGSALLDRVAHGGVHAPALLQALEPGSHAAPLPRLAELLRHLLRVVVEVAATVGPADVVHEQHGQRLGGLPCHRREHLELVVHGEPVVVAVDERSVHRREGGEHVVAEVAVEVVAPGEGALVLAGIEPGHRIDHVQLGVGAEQLEDQRGGLAALRADLHHPP